VIAKKWCTIHPTGKASCCLECGEILKWEEPKKKSFLIMGGEELIG
jgi:predicted nucleic acid-binding Zn ribbon protein